MDFILKEIGTKFYFDEENKDAGSITLKIATPADIEKIEKATTKKKVDYAKAGRYEYKDFNEKVYYEMLYDCVILDWENIKIDGEIAECNKENKIKLMKNSNAFAKFVSEKLEQLASEIDPTLSDEVKN